MNKTRDVEQLEFIGRYLSALKKLKENWEDTINYYQL